MGSKKNDNDNKKKKNENEVQQQSSAWSAIAEIFRTTPRKKKSDLAAHLRGGKSISEETVRGQQPKDEEEYQWVGISIPTFLYLKKVLNGKIKEESTFCEQIDSNIKEWKEENPKQTNKEPIAAIIDRFLCAEIKKLGKRKKAESNNSQTGIELEHIPYYSLWDSNWLEGVKKASKGFTKKEAKAGQESLAKAMSQAIDKIIKELKDKRNTT